MRFLTELIHRAPYRWSSEVDRLHEMLQAVGPEAIDRAFRAALDVNDISADFIARALGHHAAEPELFEVRS